MDLTLTSDSCCVCNPSSWVNWSYGFCPRYCEVTFGVGLPAFGYNQFNRPATSNNIKKMLNIGLGIMILVNTQAFGQPLARRVQPRHCSCFQSWCHSLGESCHQAQCDHQVLQLHWNVTSLLVTWLVFTTFCNFVSRQLLRKTYPFMIDPT